MPDISKLIDEALAIEEEDAKAAGALGFMGRALVQATLPHSKQPGSEFRRINGNYHLSIMAPSNIGLPYGTLPRLLLIWLTTEAIKTRSPEIILGSTLGEFMDELGMKRTGGRNGSITQPKNQMTRLFSSLITCSYIGSQWRFLWCFILHEDIFYLNKGKIFLTRSSGARWKLFTKTGLYVRHELPLWLRAHIRLVSRQCVFSTQKEKVNGAKKWRSFIVKI